MVSSVTGLAPKRRAGNTTSIRNAVSSADGNRREGRERQVWMRQRVACFLVLASLSAGFISGREKRMVTLNNWMLGKTERELRAQCGDKEDCTIDWPPSAVNKRFLFRTEPVFISVPRQAGSRTSSTTGAISDRGDIWMETTSVDHPASNGGFFYMHMLTVFYLNSDGVCFRWEAYTWPSVNRVFSDCEKIHMTWRLTEAREVQFGQNGKRKIIKVGHLAGFYWMK